LKIGRFSPLFVEFVPDTMEEGILYVSMPYALVAHRCACGCGCEVVTPLSPTDWRLLFDGENISLEPSIGNWSFPCRSHYYIRQGKVQWAAEMSDEQIRRGRLRDRASKEAHFAKRLPSGRSEENIDRDVSLPPTMNNSSVRWRRSKWAWLKDLFR